MGFQIENGKGTGHTAEVTKENRLNVSSRAGSRLYYASRIHGDAYIWTATADWGGDKNAIWLRNNSSLHHLFIEKVFISPATACQFEVFVGNDNTSGGTDVVGTNLHRGSGAIADATCKHTNTNVDAGSGMTLIGSGYAMATGLTPVDFQSALILRYYDEVAVNLVTDVASTSINIMGWFHH